MFKAAKSLCVVACIYMGVNAGLPRSTGDGQARDAERQINHSGSQDFGMEKATNW